MNAINSVFIELRDKGILENDSKLISCNVIPSFRPSFNKRDIWFNPEYSIQLSKDSLRFILLHEIGHTKKIQWSSIFIVSFLLGSIFIYLVCKLTSLNNYFAVISIITAYLILLTYISRHWLNQDEYDADLYAAKQLNTYFKEKEPSKILNFALKEFSVMKDNSNKLTKLLVTIGRFMNYHPLIQERVRKIEIYEQSLVT